MYRYILDNYLFTSCLYFLNFDIFYIDWKFSGMCQFQYIYYSLVIKSIIIIKWKIFVNIFLGFYTMYNSSKG